MMRHRRHRQALGATLAALCLCLAWTVPGQAFERVYQSRDAFLNDVFGGDVPEARSMWLVDERRKEAESILGHEPGFLRTRYWQRGGLTAWILDEVGKSEPITAGFVVEDQQIARVEILIYRETRGDEVRHDFFTNQFKGAEIRENSRLDRRIDSITGATLSVNAIERLARLALYLTGQTPGDSGG